jgi:hypothetical protein
MLEKDFGGSEKGEIWVMLRSRSPRNFILFDNIDSVFFL